MISIKGQRAAESKGFTLIESTDYPDAGEIYYCDYWNTFNEILAINRETHEVAERTIGDDRIRNHRTAWSKRNAHAVAITNERI